MQKWCPVSREGRQLTIYLDQVDLDVGLTAGNQCYTWSPADAYRVAALLAGMAKCAEDKIAELEKVRAEREQEAAALEAAGRMIADEGEEQSGGAS